MKNKKGISPLIASVLLIGFTVALAAIVMTWGGGFIKKTTEETSTESAQKLACAKLNLKISGNCNGIVIDNPQSVSITELTFRKYDTAGTITDDVIKGTTADPYVLKPYSSYKYNTLTGVKIIEVIPKLSSGIVCTDSPISKNLYCTTPTP